MNLKEIAKLRGTNLKKIAEECHVPPSTLYAISSGDTNFDNVGIGLFMKIADALNMSPEELYGREVSPCDIAATLSDDERILIDCYRRMATDMQKTALETAMNFAALSGSGQKGSRETASESLTSTVL